MILRLLLSALSTHLLCFALQAAPAGGAPLQWLSGTPDLLDQETSDSPGPEVAQAIGQFKSGQIDAAIALLERAHKLDSNLAPPRVMLANLFFSHNQRSAGQAELERAAIDNPKDPEVPLIFGDIAWQQRRWSDAEIQYRRALELLSDASDATSRKAELRVRSLMGLGNVAESRGQLHEAAEWFSQVVQHSTGHGNAHFRLGNALFALNQPADALREFETAAGLTELAPRPPLALARLHRQSGSHAEADQWLARALAEYPGDATPHLEFARWQLEDSRDLPAAERHIREAFKLAPQSVEPLLLAGLVARARQEPQRAVEILSDLLLRSPGHLSASAHLALALADQEDPVKRQRAWTVARVNAETHSKSSEAAAALGRVAFLVGDLKLAEQQLRKAASSGKTSRDTAFYLAQLLYRRGDFAQATDLLEQALAGQGIFVELRAARAWRQTFGTSHSPRRAGEATFQSKVK